MRFNCLLLLVACIVSCQQKNETFIGFTTTKSDFQYKIIPAAEGDSIRTGDIVKLHLIQFIDDSLLNSTRNLMPEYVKIDSSLQNFDYSEILPLMKINDSAVCLFSTKKIMKRATATTYPPLFLSKGKYIKVYVKLLQRFTVDSLALADYEKEKSRFNDIVIAKEKAGFNKAALVFDSLVRAVKSPVTTLPNGVVIQWLQKAKNGKIKQGDSVAVVYRGLLVDGSEFERTTTTKPFFIQAGERQTIEGFDTGIGALSFGDSARIFIPARLGYGAGGAEDAVPAFANIIFEVAVRKPGKFL